jgi:hypothetical protein
VPVPAAMSPAKRIHESFRARSIGPPSYRWDQHRSRDAMRRPKARQGPKDLLAAYFTARRIRRDSASSPRR